MGKGRISIAKRAVGINALASLQKVKETESLSPYHEMVKWEGVKVGRSSTLARKKRVRTRA